MLKQGMLVALLATGGVFAVSCDDDDNVVNMDGGVDALPGTGGIPGTGGTGNIGVGGDAGVVDGGGDTMAPMACPTHPQVKAGPAGFCVVSNTTLTAPMTTPLTMSPPNQWLLEGQLVVGSGTAAGATTLTVAPGTTVRGTKTNSVVVITKFSKIMAEGTAAAPIVFTSDRPVGQRASLDWGGMIINGNAPINNPVTGDAVSEGVPALYGGSNAADSSGVLKYVRIEFAGGKITAENEFNGLALGGVGNGTVIDYVQTHMTEDDGIEFFGGTVNAKHLVVTGFNDDGVDWTDGWNGKVQHVYIRKLANSGNQSSDPRGMEADNRKGDPNRMPRSLPTLSNFTILNDRTDVPEGARLRLGTGAKMWNFLIKGFPTCLYVDTEAASNIASSDLSLQNFVLNCPTPLGKDMDDTSAPALLTGKNIISAEVTLSPAGVPAAGSPALTAGATSTDAFFDQVSYAGAFNGTTNWMDGWTTTAAN